jgi:hypothetical protein
MRKTTQRHGETPENVFTEVVDGGTFPSLEVTVNAKGQYQYAIKLYYENVRDLISLSLDDLEAFDRRFRASFPIAGKD